MNRKPNDLAYDSPLRSDDFIRFLTNSNGIFWRLKQGDKQVEFLNFFPIGGVASKAEIEQLLLNLVFAQSIVVEEDFFRFKMFIKTMREHHEGTVIFRIKDSLERRFWFRLVGAPGSAEPTYFYGSLHDITEHVAFINHLLHKDLERQTMIEHDHIPVLLVEMESKTIISRNTMALQLFGFSYHEFDGKTFPDIYPPDQTSHLSKAYETCLLNGQWEGQLTFMKKDGVTFEAKVTIKRLSIGERNMLRISIHETIDNQLPSTDSEAASASANDDFSQNLLRAMAGKSTIEEVLDTLLRHPFRKTIFDSVMYADVYEEKSRVDAYARGGLFNSMKSQSSFPFQGSVSQAIRDNRLPFFIIEDTLLSTRPIDWALFIPYGVRSYFAKPYYWGDKLRSLLVFCSTEVNRFSEKDIPLYELYYPAFLQGLKNWRKNKRRSSDIS